MIYIGVGNRPWLLLYPPTPICHRTCITYINHEPVNSRIACVAAVSRLRDVQWRLDTVVVDRNLTVGELRLGLQVMDPASATQCTHNFSMSAQQLHLLLAGESCFSYSSSHDSAILTFSTCHFRFGNCCLIWWKHQASHTVASVGIMGWCLQTSCNWPLYPPSPTLAHQTPNLQICASYCTWDTLWAYVDVNLKFSWNRSVLKVEANLSKTLVSTYKTTWLYKPEHHNFVSFCQNITFLHFKSFVEASKDIRGIMKAVSFWMWYNNTAIISNKNWFWLRIDHCGRSLVWACVIP